jgi:hypothetical protein
MARKPNGEAAVCKTAEGEFDSPARFQLLWWSWTSGEVAAL